LKLWNRPKESPYLLNSKQMPSLYTHADENIRKTWLLITGFLVFIVAVGWLFSYVLDSAAILYFAVFLSIAMSVTSYWFSDKIVLSMAHATLIEKKGNPELAPRLH